MARAKKDGIHFSVYITKELHDAVKQCWAQSNGKTLTATVEDLLRRGLESYDEEEKLRQEFLNSRKKQ